MKDGDKVSLKFIDSPDRDEGVIVDHTDDWKNVTLERLPGATINGMVELGSIEELQDLIDIKNYGGHP